jgi:hypothetical protein
MTFDLTKKGQTRKKKIKILRSSCSSASLPNWKYHVLGLSVAVRRKDSEGILKMIDSFYTGVYSIL